MREIFRGILPRNRLRSAAVSKTSRSGLGPLKVLHPAPCRLAPSRALIPGFKARNLRKILSPAGRRARRQPKPWPSTHGASGKSWTGTPGSCPKPWIAWPPRRANGSNKPSPSPSLSLPARPLLRIAFNNWRPNLPPTATPARAAKAMTTRRQDYRPQGLKTGAPASRHGSFPCQSEVRLSALRFPNFYFV